MSRKFTGYIFLFLSAVIYGLFGLLSRYTGSFSPFSQSWVRYLMILFLLAILFLTKKVVWKKIQQKDIKWFLIWILPASIQPVLSFIAFNNLPIGLAYFLLYSTMILGGIVSGKIFFSEKFNLGKLLSLIFVFAGLFLIYRSDISLVQSVYVFLVLVSGLFVGFWNTLTKKVSGNYSEFQMMFLDGSSTIFVGLIGSVIMKETLPSFSVPAPWFWLFVFALSNILAGFLLIRGFKYVEAQVGSLILPMEIVFASIFGYVFLGEILKTNIYLGGFLILLGALIPALKVSQK